VQNARLITGTRRRDHFMLVLYANSIGYPSESVSGSKWQVWFASCCPGRCLSTWQMTAASCPTALGALCGQLTFRLAWCHEHSAVTATELLQPLDLACETLFRSSYAIQTSFTDCSDDSTFSRKHEHGALWLLICGTLEKNTYVLAFLLTLLTYCSEHRKATEEVGKEQLRKRHGVRNVFSRFEVQLVEDEGGSTGKRWM